MQDNFKTYEDGRKITVEEAERQYRELLASVPTGDAPNIERVLELQGNIARARESAA
jgi:hypothetical protein